MRSGEKVLAPARELMRQAGKPPNLSTPNLSGSYNARRDNLAKFCAHWHSASARPTGRLCSPRRSWQNRSITMIEPFPQISQMLFQDGSAAYRNI